MPKKKSIPPEIQEEVLKIVEEFNRKTFTGKHDPFLKAMFGTTKRGFATRFKGRFLYLDRIDRGRPTEIAA